jgi:predicted DsbA family dithiol-disulfide isomerase
MPPEGMELPQHIRARRASTGERLKQMAEAAGMEMVFAEHIPSSRRALEASEYARQRGRHEEFHKVVFRKFFGEGQDISKWEVLRAAAEEVGLEPDEMRRETETGKYRAVVEAQAAEAYELGISGVPTYILNDRYAIVGAQPYEAFKEAMAQLAAETGNDERR